MKTRFARLMVLILSAGILGIVFLVLRPSPSSATFWLLIIPAIAAILAFTVLSKREDRDYESENNHWFEQIRALVGEEDLNATLEQDPHLGDYGKKERQRIILALESMPKTKRSLRTAITNCGLDLSDIPHDQSV